MLFDLQGSLLPRKVTLHLSLPLHRYIHIFNHSQTREDVRQLKRTTNA
ncbi:MAG: hypothetical protein PVS3B1_29190 [Ktedonobacteraceae bacterium]